MNIPENILQQVADAAFAQSPSSPLSCVQNGTNWKRQPNIRRAVIQHALDNPALAPFLAGGIGEYTDEELRSAWSAAEETNTLGIRWLRAFLAALPRRESPALAQAIARAENELAALKSAQLGILRPIAEMPETVPEGCMAVFRWRDDFGSWVTGINKPTNGFFAILRLPAEATPPAEQSESESNSLEKQAIQEAAYILNHYDRKSHSDHVCLGKKLLREGWKGSNYRLPAADDLITELEGGAK